MRSSDWSSDVCSSDLTWSVSKSIELAHEVETALRGPDWKHHLKYMYGNKPVRWKETFQGHKRMRAIINAMTRMRMCTADGDMEFKHKREPADGPGLVPWFDVPDRVAPDVTVGFGHWSALGLDRTRVVSGKSVSVRVELGGGRYIKKK